MAAFTHRAEPHADASRSVMEAALAHAIPDATEAALRALGPVRAPKAAHAAVGRLSGRERARRRRECPVNHLTAAFVCTVKPTTGCSATATAMVCTCSSSPVPAAAASPGYSASRSAAPGAISVSAAPSWSPRRGARDRAPQPAPRPCRGRPQWRPAARLADVRRSRGGSHRHAPHRLEARRRLPGAVAQHVRAVRVPASGASRCTPSTRRI